MLMQSSMIIVDLSSHIQFQIPVSSPKHAQMDTGPSLPTSPMVSGPVPDVPQQGQVLLIKTGHLDPRQYGCLIHDPTSAHGETFPLYLTLRQVEALT